MYRVPGRRLEHIDPVVEILYVNSDPNQQDKHRHTQPLKNLTQYIKVSGHS